MEYYDLIQSYKRRTNVMNRCSIPKFCEKYKIDIKILRHTIPKAKEYSLGMLNRGTYVYIFMKINIVLFGKKIDEVVQLMV